MNQTRNTPMWDYEVMVVLFGGAKDQEFFSLLVDAARNIAASAKEYVQMSANLDQAAEYADRLYKLEKKGDQCTHDVITLLNKMFVTPLEREDILTLAVKIDDVTDGLEAAASRIALYKIKCDKRFLKEFGDLILKQAEQIVEALDKLAAKNLRQIRDNAVEINRLENLADTLLRDALEDLFEDETNPVKIIKLKEIYETLESVTDRAEDVANALESIVMKNS